MTPESQNQECLGGTLRSRKWGTVAQYQCAAMLHLPQGHAVLAWIHEVLEYLVQSGSSPLIPNRHSVIGTMSSIGRRTVREEIYRMDGSRTVGDAIPQLIWASRSL